MKKRRSFFKRHIILLSILIGASVFSLVQVTTKEFERQALEAKSVEYQNQIAALRTELADKQRYYDRIGTLDFVEEYARENFKMVMPDEIYFQIQKGKEETE